MTIDEVLTYYDHKGTNVARALDIHKMNICLWRKNKKVPYLYQCRIAYLTKGVLKTNEADY